MKRKFKIDKNKVYQFIGQVVVWGCFYIGGIVFCYWGVLQATVYR